MVRGTDPVTAENFDYAWKRMLAPASGSPLPNLLYDIQGARAYHQDLCDLIFERVGQFQAEAVQYDDMALLVVRADAVD